MPPRSKRLSAKRSKRLGAKAAKSPKRRSKRLAAKASAKTSVQMGYCVKCRKVHEISDAKEVTLKNGRKALKGKCEQTGVGMFKFIKN